MYHATREVLQKLDSVQKRFLSDVGVDEITALMEFNLAPLRTRRDIAMLGMLHRAKLGLGPPQFRELFKPCQGGYQLRDAYEGSGRTALIRRSVWGPCSRIQPARKWRTEHQDCCRLPALFTGAPEESHS